MSHRLRLAVLPLVLAASGGPGRRPEARRPTLTGQDALGDWTTDAPGVRRKITVADLARPYDTPSAKNYPRVVKRPDGAWPKAPAGFEVTEFATGLTEPRVIARAPNGDLFLAESSANRVRVFRDADGDGKPEVNEVFATGLNRPFGIAFYPVGPEPKYVYVGNTDAVVRFPYKSGDTKAAGAAETVVKDIPSGNESVGGGGHWTRDLEFSPDGKTLYVVGRLPVERRRRREGEPPGVHPGVRPRRQERAGLRLRHPQPGRAGHAPEDRPALDVGERAGRARRQPGARLHHARQGGRVLRLAVVLPRPEPGPAAPGQAARAEGQGDRPGRALAVAHGVARPDVLRRHPVPEGVPPRRLRRPSTARGTGRAASGTRSSGCR